MKQIARAEDNGSGYVEKMASEMRARIEIIGRFVQARKAAKKEPLAMVSICEALLKEPAVEVCYMFFSVVIPTRCHPAWVPMIARSNAPPLPQDAIRVEDCLALLVQHHHGNGDMAAAYRYVQDMEARNVAVASYLEPDVLEAVCRAVGAPLSPPPKHGGGGDHGARGGGGDAKGMGSTGGRSGGGGGVSGEDLDEELDEEIEEALGSDDEGGPVSDGPKWGRPYAAPKGK